MKRRLLFSIVATTLALGVSSSYANEVLKVGASPVPHADILKVVQPELAKKGIDLRIIEFSDYVQPNLALHDGDLDANYFQHKPYLTNFAQERGLKLTSIGNVHIEPMGIYSKKIQNLENLKSGATVGIPNDPTNGGRALKVLETAGLIKLDPKVGIQATPLDVLENSKQLKFYEIEAAVLPRSLDDFDLSVINSNFALGAGLNPAKDALALESKDSPYANVVAVRDVDFNRSSIKELMKELHSDKVRKFISDKYQGAVVPAF